MSEIATNSLWSQDIQPSSSRSQLESNLETDVAIVGAGYSGLWTTYYLLQRNPELNITIIDANTVGFGASGRNGGWCSALFPTSIDKLASKFGGIRALAMQQAMLDNLAEMRRIVELEAIECDWAQGGTVAAVRNSVQLDRAREEVVNLHRWGFANDHVRFLNNDELAATINISNALTATYTPYCAAIHPGKLVHSLAKLVESRGARIYEHTPAIKIRPHRVVTNGGVINARFIVRATEGFTSDLQHHTRKLLPLYSLMIATEPLAQEVWDEIGLHRRETFTDYRNLIIYGQRTADNRIAFGGRGARYHFGSTISAEYDQDASVHNALKDTLVELFPVLNDFRISHRWGGPLGVPRDWMPSVGLRRDTGFAWAGGYVGDGVATSHLAGRTLADLITKNKSALTGLPWVNHKSRTWEPEPLRWIGTNAGIFATKYADAVEGKRNKRSRIGSVIARLTGH